MTNYRQHDDMVRYVALRAPELAAPAATPAATPRHRADRAVTVRLTSARRGWTVRQLAGVAIVGALIGLWVAPGRAYADPTPAPAALYVSRVDPAPAGPRITVTLSNGRTDVLRPCRYEDGRQCYWQADTMGNGRGTSFVVTRGHVFPVDLSGMALAAVTR